MEEKGDLISEISDSDFISFLYSERDRENSLSQFQGWNNWAIVGAVVTIVCTIYAIWKKEVFMDMNITMYGFSSVISLYLLIKFYSVLFKQERGYDHCRVRVLKEQVPIVDILLILISSICVIALSLWNGQINLVFWSWTIVLLMYVVTVIIEIINRDKVMPAYYEDFYFTNLRAHTLFCGFVGGFCSLIFTESLKHASSNFFSSEFEIGACVAAILILVSLFLKINTGNRSVSKFDAIIDRYIYAGATRTVTFREIQVNRVGYGALEVCHKELAVIKEALDEYDKKENELERISAAVSECDCDYDQIRTYLEFIGEILNAMRKTNKVSRKLSIRLDEIMALVPDYSKIEELSYIIDLSCQMADKLESMIDKIEHIHALLAQGLKSGSCKSI